jgi:hypothetical protein
VSAPEGLNGVDNRGMFGTLCIPIIVCFLFAYCNHSREGHIISFMLVASFSKANQMKDFVSVQILKTISVLKSLVDDQRLFHGP